ncbi:MAG: phosphate signaling complex protein PhoU [Deltaproteobacteria bacterium]|nr:phosphate signaling complex protein PhoU [Deltaproteobacteria bacterium]
MKETQFHRHLYDVREDLVRMAGLVETSVHQAVISFLGRDAEGAREVIRTDRRIDLMENDIEKKCLGLLATQQPVAGDLRFISSTLKIISYLERMGDQAVNLAQRGLALGELEPMPAPPTLVSMGEIAQEMVGSCLDAHLKENVDLAVEVLRRDDDLDRLCRSFLEEMVGWMNQEQRIIRRAVELILASRHLERVGDEATNIAEEVIYWLEGRIVRHGGPKPDQPGD